MIIFAVSGILLFSMPPELALLVRSARFRQYFGTHSVSVLGLAERCAMMLGISILWNIIFKKENTISEKELLLYKVYIYGFSLSMLLMTWSLMSSRMAAPMKAVEVLLITMLLAKMGKTEYKVMKELATLALVSYILVMTTKNLYTYIQQGKPFYDAYNPITYPYINVINKYDYIDIWYHNELYQNFVTYRDIQIGGLSYWPIY